MNSFLIARLTSQSKSLDAVEFMQRNAFSFHISSNSVLLNALMSPEGVEGRLAAQMGFLGGFEPGEEEKHVVGQMTNIFDFKKEVKEEVVIKKEIVEDERNDVLEQSKGENGQEGEEYANEADDGPSDHSEITVAPPAESEEVLHESAMEPVHDEDLLELDASLLYQVPNEESPLADLDAVDDLDAPGGDDILNLSMDSGITEPIDKMDTVNDKNEEAIAENMDDTLLMAPQGNDFLDPLDFDETSIREESSESQNLLKNVSVHEEEIEEEEEQLEKESEDDEEGSEEEEEESDEDYEVRNTKQNVQKKRRCRTPGTTSVGRRLFSCPMGKCPSSFRTFEELKEHMKNHSGKEKICDVCKKNFPSVLQAMEHMKKREDWKCCGCGKQCSTKQVLIQHHRVHTKEKPYGCDQCGKRFAFAAAIRTHMMMHSGLEPFSCSICNKKFANKSRLDLHNVVHTKEKPFECRQCKKGFNRKDNLERHEKTHTGERPFSCKKCDAKFAQKSHLDRHMKRKHP